MATAIWIRIQSKYNVIRFLQLRRIGSSQSNQLRDLDGENFAASEDIQSIHATSSDLRTHKRSGDPGRGPRRRGVDVPTHLIERLTFFILNSIFRPPVLPSNLSSIAPNSQDTGSRFFTPPHYI